MVKSYELSSSSSLKSPSLPIDHHHVANGQSPPPKISTSSPTTEQNNDDPSPSSLSSPNNHSISIDHIPMNEMNGMNGINDQTISSSIPTSSTSTSKCKISCKMRKKPFYKRELPAMSFRHIKQISFIENCFYKYLFYIAIFVLYNSFLAYAIHKSWHRTQSYCDGVKLLTIITALSYAYSSKIYLIDPFILRTENFKNFRRKFTENFLTQSTRYYLRIAAWLVTLLLIATIIGYHCYHQPERLLSVGGYFGFIFIAFLCSKHRKHINWHQILWGFTIQLIFGIFVLQTLIGRIIFQCIGDKINLFLSYTHSGTEMVFGYLSNGKLKGTINGNYTVKIIDNNNNNNSNSNNDLSINELHIQIPSLPLFVQNSIFALNGMPVIIFFSFFVSILYYYGIMQIIVNKFGQILQSTIGTTACESISASGNIFLGMCESPLLVKPFLPIMTKSELHAIMSGGFATIAGSVMAAYISFGISATHLLSASVMAAPSALALSKLIYPEIEQSKTTVEDIKLEKGPEKSAIEAGSNGAISAVSLVASILANLIAFVSFLTFLDAIISYFGEMIDLPDLSFKMILSKLFIPIAMMLGIEWSDTEYIAGLIGIKMFINEFVAYQQLSEYIANDTITQRSQTIATFALCGFANLSSIGIQVGSLSTLAPSRSSDLAELAFSAMLTGSIACFTTACVAGMFI